ncbi:VOC family protein [Streptomyces sp. NPDC016845]|uniref:VOC family protein n=1 Tax=Streptomyces sp. NPDC016845 TaxID=3364972 RepID=UPI003793FD9A
MSTKSVPTDRSPARLHHIGVQTTDLDNCASWYEDFFGCRRTWSTNVFSPLTLHRLPGITRMLEMALGDTRFHLFERVAAGTGPPESNPAQFQHVCMAVADSARLRAQRTVWCELYASGRYAFSLPDPPSDIVIDDDGVESFYCLDVNGLEFEFAHLPVGGNR